MVVELLTTSNFLFLLLLILALEPLQHEALFAWSINLMVNFNNINIQNIHTFFLSVTKFLGPFLMIGTLVIKFAYYERPRAFYYATVVCSIVFVQNLFEMIYRQPRPFMVIS